MTDKGATAQTRGRQPGGETLYLGKLTPSARLIESCEGVFCLASTTCMSMCLFRREGGTSLERSAALWAIKALERAACISSLALYEASCPEEAT